MKRGEIPSIGGLTSFVSAARHGSFTRAAKELNLSQGAISRQIREVETQLGVRLFERIRQRVVLTDVGQLYLTYVKKALVDLSVATQKVVAFSDNTMLSLLVLPTFAARWLIPRLADFQKKYPKIMIHLTTRQTPVEFAIETFDAAIFFGSPNWPGTIAHHLMDMEIIAVCSPKLKAKRIIKTPEDVVKFPLLHQMTRPRRWADWMAEVGVKLDGPLKGHSYQLAMLSQAAVAGLGIALLPRYLVEEELGDGRLEIVASEFIDMKASYYLIVPETRTSSNAVQTFANWLMSEVRTWSLDNGVAPNAKPTRRRLNGRNLA